jgi:dTDP-4-amino-4,6-dideoxy-D-galactose acyltransferase
LAEACGFGLADVRLTLGRSAARAGTGDSALQAVRPAEACDLAALEPVAAGVHTDSRFFFDERFDRAAAADLYRRWLRASLAGELADLAYVAEAGGEPAGYITGRTDPATATVAIGLLGLAERARGKGLGTRLVAALLAGASGAGAERITVVTQGRNVQAQRLYQRAGFRTERVELWYHWWSGPGRPAAPGG